MRGIRLLLCLALLLYVGCSGDDGPRVTPDMGDNNPDMVEGSLRVTGISPNAGSMAGGTQVEVSGEGFESGASLRFASLEALDVEVVSDVLIRGTTPASPSAGAVTVVVRNPGGESSSLPNAFTFVDDSQPNVDFCQLQAQSPVRSVAGVETPGIYAIVFMEGVTQGEGQGAGIIGELGWGQGPDVEGYAWSAMSYNEDKDGLGPGDLANDEYGASLTIPTAGEYRYVARFRAEARPDEWIYCDLSGSDDGFSFDDFGVLLIEDPAEPSIDYCQLQPQGVIQATTGVASESIYAFVFAEGITQGQGQGSAIEAELGFGGSADPSNFTFVPLTYFGDLDGLQQGDLANDEYSASLTIPNAGTYRYIARFRVEGGDWVHCGLDGPDNLEEAQFGTIEVTDPAVPAVTFCRTETAGATALTGQASPVLTGLVYIAGVTNGAGPGADVEAQVVWGDLTQSPMDWTEVVAAEFHEDADGLTPGDLANDRYRATITATSEGEYGYVFRFRYDGGDWSYCDTDGSDGSSAGFEEDKVGVLEVFDTIVVLPTSCETRFPHLRYAVEVGESHEIYGRVISLGNTGGAQAHPSISAQLVIGLDGTDPSTWDLIDADFQTDVIDRQPDEDEYGVTWVAPQAGTYAYYYRFSADGGTSWRRCGISGTSDSTPFDSRNIGVIDVYDPPVSAVGYCHVWQANLVPSMANPDPVVTVEIFEDGITTQGGADPGQLEVQPGWGPVGANPALSQVFTWKQTSLGFARIPAGRPNNYEYEGAAWDNAPPSGSHRLAARVRVVGTQAWTYCDNDITTMEFDLHRLTQVTVP